MMVGWTVTSCWSGFDKRPVRSNAYGKHPVTVTDAHRTRRHHCGGEHNEDEKVLDPCRIRSEPNRGCIIALVPGRGAVTAI